MIQRNASGASLLRFIAAVGLLAAAGCESSPFKDGSRVEEDPEQAVIDGDGGDGGGMESEDLEGGEDVDQDPNIGAPMR
jgi:hypothetical protein